MTGADPKNLIVPDPNGAVGKASLIAATNLQIEGLRKDGSTIFGPTHLSDMFSSFDIKAMTDPKIAYDADADRFVLIVLKYDPVLQASRDLAYNDGSNMSAILVAASKNGNPLSVTQEDWYFLEINSFVDDMMTDFPRLAVDGENIYITGNLVTKDDHYAKSLLWVLPKLVLYSGTATESDVHRLDFLARTGAQDWYGENIYLPARRAGSYLVAVLGNESVNVVHVTNATADPTSGATFRLTNVPFGPLGNGNSSSNLPAAPQKGTDKLICTNDIRTLDVVWANSSLWVTFDVTDGDVVMACWLKITVDAASDPNSLADEGCIHGDDETPDAFSYYPSIDVNSKGVMALGFSGSDRSMYASAYATIRDDVNDAPGTVRAAEVVREGEAPYYVVDRGDKRQRNRWGDYTGMWLDPTDEDCFWAFNEFAVSAAWSDERFGNWKTAWARLCYPPKPHPNPTDRSGSKRSKSSGSSKSKRRSGSKKASSSSNDGSGSASRKGSGSGSGSRSMKGSGSRSMKGSGSGSRKGSRSKKGSRKE